MSSLIDGFKWEEVRFTFIYRKIMKYIFISTWKWWKFNLSVLGWVKIWSFVWEEEFAIYERLEISWIFHGFNRRIYHTWICKYNYEPVDTVEEILSLNFGWNQLLIIRVTVDWHCLHLFMFEINQFELILSDCWKRTGGGGHT